VALRTARSADSRQTESRTWRERRGGVGLFKGAKDNAREVAIAPASPHRPGKEALALTARTSRTL